MSTSDESSDPAETSEEQLDLARSLFARANRSADARAALRASYPSAPEAMIDTAAFHIYVDGVDAALEFLADAERALREPKHRPDVGIAYHLLYHLYNWLQFEALLPDGHQDVVDLTAELRKAAKEKDWETVSSLIGELDDVVSGSRSAPQIS